MATCHGEQLLFLLWSQSPSNVLRLGQSLVILNKPRPEFELFQHTPENTDLHVYGAIADAFSLPLLDVTAKCLEADRAQLRGAKVPLHWFEGIGFQADGGWGDLCRSV
ncbi:MAG TPA: hypothetical protein VMW15_08505 [Terracidiphilus sp.]|nr:hypothetical protein [Terracidiphilus sp.]